MLDKEVIEQLRVVVFCGECRFAKNSKTVPCAYRCDYTLSPCRGRVTSSDFGCTYGKPIKELNT